MYKEYKYRGPRIPLKEILVENSTFQTNKLRHRLLNEGVKKHRCENCGLTNWNKKPIPLEIDHINGKCNDHRLENIKILCPNCHAQTKTYKGKNTHWRKRA
jgi:5-methylcytosine-specific restriction endonuclease McrA